MDVMSCGVYAKLQFESDVYLKLKEAEMEADHTSKRFSHKEVFDNLRKYLVMYAKRNTAAAMNDEA